MAFSILRSVYRKTAPISLNTNWTTSISTTVNHESRISSPLLMLAPSFEGNEMSYNFYNPSVKKILRFLKKGEELPDNNAKFIGSSHGWLASFNESNFDLFLSNPVSERHIKLPPINTLSLWEPNFKSGFGRVHKLILSCPPNEKDEDEEGSCRVIMSFGCADRVGFCCPGHSERWRPLYAAACKKDFVFCGKENRFYSVTGAGRYGEVECWDLGDPESPKNIWGTSIDGRYYFDEEPDYLAARWDEEDSKGLSHNYIVFVEQLNEVFLVVRRLVGPEVKFNPLVIYHFGKEEDNTPRKTIGFDVYKFDGEKGELRYMNEGSLDGLAMFVGLNHSFALTAKEYPELKPNSIYFSDDWTSPYCRSEEVYGHGHDLGIFHYENKTISPYYPSDIQSIERNIPPPLWFTPSR